jgi:hypothetical protein
MTLTAKQKEYRKLKAEGKHDRKFVVREDGKRVKVVARRKICVRVSETAYQRLTREAEQLGMSQQDLLTRMLLKGLPRYSSLSSTFGETHVWRKELLYPNSQPCRYKKGGEKQLNLFISSTAWNKLHSHKTATKLSKARIVDAVIRLYRFLTPEEAQRHRDYLMRNKREFEEWTKFRDSGGF